MTTPNSANPMVAAKSHLSGYNFLAMTKLIAGPTSKVRKKDFGLWTLDFGLLP